VNSAAEQTRPTLLCWDGSEAAAHAMRSAASLFDGPRPAIVVFAHGPVESPPRQFSGADALGTPILRDERAEEILELGVRAANDAGFEATGLLVPAANSAASAISDAADEQDARMIVLGQPQRSAVGRYLLGSVARDVLSQEHRPVLLVGSGEDVPAEEAAAVDGDAADRPVLLCWDGSETAGRAIEHTAAILGRGRRATVLFAHVPTESAQGILGGFSGPDAPIMGHADVDVLMEEGVRMARTAGFEPEALPVVADAKTSEIIVRTADAEGSALIAMGQRTRSGFGRLVLGSVAREVLESHHRPVLLAGPAGSGVYPRSR
jgi:nucleotide-binding universal stress UspA family protein